MRIVHPDRKIEAFFNVWAKKVCLNDIANEFARHFLIDGNVVVKRITGKLNKPVENQWLDKVTSSVDIKVYKENDDVESREIPMRYSFLNLCALDWVGGELAKMAGQKILSFNLSQTLINKIKNPTEDFDKKIVDSLPQDIREKIASDSSGKMFLDMSKIYVAHNKKDSWDDWAPPFLVSVLSDINFREKLRQAEISALDGVINVIRLWKIGDHKEGILPDDAAVEKLINILEANTGGGAMDIVWDSMISMEPFYPPVDKILGSEKYVQVNRDILIGLGVPEVLIGGDGANFSNSSIQLKTLIEKLQSVRKKLSEWLDEELRLICKAMDFPSLPKVKFSKLELQDENVNKKLIIGLLDRGIISAEAVLEAYGEDFFIEIEKIKQQGPIFKKAGIEVKSPFDSSQGQAGEGRPVATKDVGRDQRTPKPKVSGKELNLFALDAVDSIDEYVIPLYMEQENIQNARKLTASQKDEINKIRSIVLSCVKYGDDISEDGILSISENASSLNQEIVNKIDDEIKAFASKNGQMPTLAQRKRIEALCWSEYYS
jgi:hypothetical protein